jgi:hypothetical protein
MPRIRSIALGRIAAGLAVLLVFKVTLSVVTNYRHYVPPDFGSDFLVGRQSYFWGPYHWAFYVHLVSAPTSLVAGTILISDRFRRRMPGWHRRLGRLQVGCILLFVTPSGLWMAWYAATGTVAAAGLALLALATGWCTAMGWRTAVARRFVEHRRWMWRTYALLCSAVVIRLIAGLATVVQFDALWLYPLSAWASWLVPLVALELLRLVGESSDVVVSSSNRNESPQRRRLYAGTQG